MRAAIRFVTPVVMLTALALGLMLAPFACGPGKPGSTFAGSFAACAKADLGQIVGGTQGKTLLDDVRDKIRGNAPTLVADLDGLALTVGIDAVECAVAAVVAVLSAPVVAAGSGSSAPPATNAEPAGVLKARAWLASHQKGNAP